MDKVKFFNPYKKFRKEQCYQLSEYIIFIEKYFKIRVTQHIKQFGQKVSLGLLDTNIEIILEWYNKENYPSEVRVEWFKSWRSQDQSYINLCWEQRLNDRYNMSWFIVDHKISSYIEISKEEIFDTILNFILDNEKNLSVQLKRESKLRKLLSN